MKIFIPQKEGDVVLPNNSVLQAGQWNEVRGREKNYDQVQEILERQFKQSSKK